MHETAIGLEVESPKLHEGEATIHNQIRSGHAYSCRQRRLVSIASICLIRWISVPILVFRPTVDQQEPAVGRLFPYVGEYRSSGGPAGRRTRVEFHVASVRTANTGSPRCIARRSAWLTSSALREGFTGSLWLRPCRTSRTVRINSAQFYLLTYYLLTYLLATGTRGGTARPILAAVQHGTYIRWRRVVVPYVSKNTLGSEGAPRGSGDHVTVRCTRNWLPSKTSK